MASILTTVGESKISSATPLDQLNVTHIAVGDGGGVFPALSPAMTELANETWRGSVSAPIRDPGNANIIIFEGVIPANDGGYYIREMAIFDDDGDMIAVGHTSEMQKPAPGSEQGLTLTVRLHVALSSESDIDLIYSEGGSVDHQGLTNRNALNAHPSSSITTDNLPDLDLSAGNLWSVLLALKSGAVWQVMEEISDANDANETKFYTLPVSGAPENTPDDTKSAIIIAVRGGENSDVVFQFWAPANDDLLENYESIYFRTGTPPYDNIINWTNWTTILSSRLLGIGAPVTDANSSAAFLPGLHALPYAPPSYPADNSPIAGVEGSILTIPYFANGNQSVQVWFGRNDDGSVTKGHIAYRFGSSTVQGTWTFLYQPGEFFLYGAIMPFATTVSPRGWLKCNGAAVSRTTYDFLFARIGEAYGAGDGSTTFNLPDLRGEFLRGFDDGRGVDAGRTFGSVQEATELGLVDGSYGNNIQGMQFSEGASGDTVSLNNSAGFTAGPVTFDYYGVRPRNVAIDYYIKF